MNRKLAKTVVECLRLSKEPPDVSSLKSFQARDWEATLRWLDRSGLTLYLLRRLDEQDVTAILPQKIYDRINNNRAENRVRVDYIANEFASINQRFQEAGVRFAVIKGFSLVPSFCPDATLRAASDLDYLVDRESLTAARRALEEEGYLLCASTDIEFKFAKPATRMPTTADDPYSRQTEPMIELHLAFWKEDQNGFALQGSEFQVARTVSHEWQGLRFPVLREEDAFRLQVEHLFQHMLDGWIKLCWLLEISHFLKGRASDTQVWSRIDAGMQAAPPLPEFAGIVVGMALTVFDPPLPPVAKDWVMHLRPAPTVWLRDYMWKWIIEEHPFDNRNFFSAAKLSLLLHREYLLDPVRRKEVTRERLFPWKRPQRIAVVVNKNPGEYVQAGWLQWQFVLRRLIFHVGATLRYFCELRQWHRRNSRSSPLLVGGAPKPRQRGVATSPAAAEKPRSSDSSASD